MDVVAGSAKVFVESEQDVDARALVALHDVVEHIVGKVEEHDGAHGKGCYEEVLRHSPLEPLIDEYADDDHDDGGLNPDDVEGYDETRNKQGGYRGKEAIAHDVPDKLAVAQVDPQQPGCEGLDEEHDAELRKSLQV